MMNSSLFLCHAHLYAGAVSLVRGFCPRYRACLCIPVPCFCPLSGTFRRDFPGRCRHASYTLETFQGQSHATQITMIRLMPFCRFVKEKRPFLKEFRNFWILYQYPPLNAPALYPFFSHSHKNTIVRHHRTHFSSEFHTPP